MVSRFPSLPLRPGILLFGPLAMLLAFVLGACAETQPETQIIAEGTTGQAPLMVSFTSDSSGVDEYRWDFGDGTFTNTITSFPVDHEYTRVGSYLVTLTVIREADPPKPNTATVTISVEPGPLESLLLDVDEVVLAPREEHAFLVTAFDQFDNPIPGLEADYQVDDQAGSVDAQGNFTAGTIAGTYTGALNVHLSQGSITRSASASVLIEPGSLDRVGLEPIAVSIDILDVIKFSAAAYDRFGNPIEGLDTIFVTDTKVGQVNDSGTFIAGTKTGTHQRGVVAEVTDGTRTRTGGSIIIINPGKLDHVRVEPDVATLSVTEEQQFTATALDQFENNIPDLPVTFKADELVGEVDSEGNFLAVTVPGVYDGALTVEVSQGVITSTATAQITIESGPLDRIVVEPATATMDVTSQLQFVATGVDSFDNSIPNITFTFQSDQLVGEIDAEGFLTASTLAGTYDGGVTVEGSQGDITKEAEALVIVEPGPLEQVTLEPTILEVAVTGAIQIVAQGLDEFANPILGLLTTFRTDLQAGQIDDEGTFTAGTKAGTFPEGVTVELSQGALTRTAAAQVVVEPGTVDRVLLSVDTISLDIGDSHGFTAQAVDTFDNPILGAEISWVATEEVGTITEDGLITVGTMAGTFEQAITGFATVGDVSVGASASVTVNPDPLATLSVLPVAIVAADTQQLVVSAADRFGNPIEDLDVVWSLKVDDAGSLTSSGELTAGEVAQSFLGSTEALVTQDEVTLIATGDLAITPGPLDKVVVAPGLAEIGMGKSQRFVAVGADQFGNLISDLTITWSVEAGEGSIDGTGLYSAGVVASTGVSVKATAVQGTIARDATASITVEPDRIAFISDQEGIDQVYTMGSDGSNVESVTIGGAFNFDWTVNGRSLVYESPEGIVSINDNGSWPILLLRDVIDFDFGIYLLNFEPRYSPDGTKIAFVEVEFPPLEDGSPDFENFDRDILVMDVDGGNVVRLTDTSDGDEFVPSWSPDSAQIVYDFTPVGELGDIWVLSLDGTTNQRLTTDPANDSFPSFSPDGTEILFTSDRDGNNEIYVMDVDGNNLRNLTNNPAFDDTPSWSLDGSQILFTSTRDGDDDLPETVEIYVMDADGNNVQRLTDNLFFEDSPRWVPTKIGVDVNESSVVIPGASILGAQKVIDVIAEARESIVLVETNFGTGTGFIIDSHGFILTNNHVINEASEIMVTLDDDTEYSATIVGRDLIRDLAVLQIEATGLPALELGNISQLPIGSEVLVIGYPLGSFSFTQGVASAFLTDIGRNRSWVQTDSAINPGNSGGPMLNLQGQVVGVVSSKFVGETIEGIGFAISATTVKLYLDRLMDGEIITS